MTHARTARLVPVLSALSLVLLLAPPSARAEGGAICAWVARMTRDVDQADPASDVYRGAGSAWLTDALKMRYRQAGEAPATAAALRAQLNAVKKIVEQSEALNASENGTRARTRVIGEFERLDAALAILDQNAPVALDKLTPHYGLARLDQSPASEEQCDGITYTTSSLYFADALSSDQVVLGASERAAAGVPGLSIPVEAQPKAALSITEASEFRAALTAAKSLVSEALAQAVRRASQRLAKIDEGWANYLEHGFSQYPWEAAINSLGTLRWDQPPKTQWVVLHPEAAVVLDVRSRKDASVAAALLVHALGFIGYGGATRSWFLGVSATGAVTTSSNFGMGAGGTLHLGHAAVYTKVPNLSLSGLLFATQSGKVGPFIAISADLWRLVSDSSKVLFEEAAPKS